MCTESRPPDFVTARVITIVVPHWVEPVVQRGGAQETVEDVRIVRKRVSGERLLDQAGKLSEKIVNYPLGC